MHAPLAALRTLVYAALLSVTAGAAAAQTADRTGAGATMQGKVRPIAAEQYLLLGAHTASQKQVSETAHNLNAIVLRNPAYSPPMGMDIAPVVKARSPHIGVNRSAIKYELAQSCSPT